MATKQFLTKANLEYIVSKLYARGFKGLGLSQEDFTTELKNKLNALVAASSPDDLADLFSRVEALEQLIEADSDGAINKFNEIVAFLNGVEDTSTLSGILAAKANTADVYTKAEADAKFLTEHQSLADYAKTADVNASLLTKANVDDVYTKAEVDTALSGKVNEADLAAITTAEIDEIINPSAGA